MTLIHILVVDDDTYAATTLAALLRTGATRHFSVDVAFDGARAVALARQRHPRVAVLDLEMPELDGVATAFAIKTALFDVPLLLVAVSGNPLALAEARRSGIFDHAMNKPVDIDHLTGLFPASPP